MQATPHLSPVQQANLTMLLYVRDSALHSRASAACAFGIGPNELDAVLALSPQDLVAFVTRGGDQCLFAPRDDLVTLLRLPDHLLGPAISARPIKRRKRALVPNS